MNTNRLIEVLREKNVSEELIDQVVDSGYIIRPFSDPISGTTWESIGDKMFGNKQFSSYFGIDEFIGYINGVYNFPRLPEFIRYTARNYEDIHRILSEPRRQHYMKEGRLSFRGQTSQYTYKRKIPSPVRSDKDGKEISIVPGLFRQSGEHYSFNIKHEEKSALDSVLHELEPNNPNIYIDSPYLYDIMRVEQHYASQTAGLDISFDIETAIFFATYKFQKNMSGKAYHRKIQKGDHQGVIYGFCFTDPPVKKTEFLIDKFDLFKTYRPERIIRQNCGLPLFGDHERNIAITDLDFIIKLDKDFDYEGKKDPLYMFPNANEDRFYGKLLELRDKHPDLLADIIEYENARV